MNRLERQTVLDEAERSLALLLALEQTYHNQKIPGYQARLLRIVKSAITHFSDTRPLDSELLDWLRIVIMKQPFLARWQHLHDFSTDQLVEGLDETNRKTWERYCQFARRVL